MRYLHRCRRLHTPLDMQLMVTVFLGLELFISHSIGSSFI